MIATLQGVVVESSPLHTVIEAGGVGYELAIPITTAERLPAAGGEIRLYVHAVYREDSAALYGFYEREDRDLFRILLDKVSGVGPRIALNVLSRLPPENLRQAVAANDVAAISRCPGIGKKTAERLIIELRDKLGPSESHHPASGSPPTGASSTTDALIQDGMAALVALGYRAAEAEKAVRRVLKNEGSAMPVETLIRKALQKDGS